MKGEEKEKKLIRKLKERNFSNFSEEIKKHF